MMDTAATTTDSEYFYEKEAEYYGFTPFQFLDEIGEIVVKAVFGMFDETPRKLAQGAPFLTKGQIEAVRQKQEPLVLTCLLFLGNRSMVSCSRDALWEKLRAI